MFKLLFDLWQHVLAIKLTGRAKKKFSFSINTLHTYMHAYIHTYINYTIYEENISASLLS